MALGGFRVCPKCGYENPDTAVRCTHCRARLEVEQRGSEVPAPEEPDAPVDPSSARVVTEELRLANGYFEKGGYEIARLFFRNASALALLCEKRPPAAKAGLLLARIKECEQHRVWTRRKCPLCNGDGKVPLRGGSSLPTVAGRRCPHCKGRGLIRARATLDEVKLLAGRARREYGTMQRARGFLAVGNAWVPEAMARALSLQDRVRVIQILADPCPDCLGMGRIDCKQCRGRGVVPCPAKGCEGGWVKVDAKGGLTKSLLRRTEKCKTCSGTGVIPCEHCGGKGSLLCETCSGVGERPVCENCHGAGIVACRKCRGTGVYRDAPCPQCGGKGRMLCDDCGGDGRER